MAISDFQQLTLARWEEIEDNYYEISPSVEKIGENDPSLTFRWYLNKNDDTVFVVVLSSTSAENLHLNMDQFIANQLDLNCTVSAGTQPPVYYEFDEDEGWTDQFGVTLSLTNTNSKKGTWTFTKGKGEDDFI